MTNNIKPDLSEKTEQERHEKAFEHLINQIENDPDATEQDLRLSSAMVALSESST